MTTMRTDIVAGWGAPGDRHVILLSPSYVPNTKPGIIWCGPYHSSALNVAASGLGAIWAHWGYPVVCVDLGNSRVGGVAGAASEWNGVAGPQLWTSAVPLGALDAVYNTIFPAIGALPGKCGISGGSAGGCQAYKWAYDNPSKVFGVLTVIGATDLLEVQQRPLAPYAAEITALFGDPIPDDRNPAALAATWPIAVPVRAYYSGQDSTVLPSTTLAFTSTINAIGGRAEAIMHNNNNHDYYTDLPAEEAAGWLIAQA